jgi:hypothetical protein
MKAEIQFAQSDVLDDTKEATEINKEDAVRQDFPLTSSSAQRLGTRSWIYGQYDDAEEEAESKGGTSTEQKKSFADEDEAKTILVRKKSRKTGMKMMRMLHKHLEDAEEKGS